MIEIRHITMEEFIRRTIRDLYVEKCASTVVPRVVMYDEIMAQVRDETNRILNKLYQDKCIKVDHDKDMHRMITPLMV